MIIINSVQQCEAQIYRIIYKGCWIDLCVTQVIICGNGEILTSSLYDMMSLKKFIIYIYIKLLYIFQISRVYK